MRKNSLLLSVILLAIGLTGISEHKVQAGSETLPFIRLYNPVTNDHFYTSSDSEAQTAQSQFGYKIEGYLGYIYKDNILDSNPVYRLWNPSAAKHFYTARNEEADQAVQGGFVREGIVGYMHKGANVGLYRVYNPTLYKHFYTTSLAEVENLKKVGYVYEGMLGNGLLDQSLSTGGFALESQTVQNGTVGGYFTAPYVVRYLGPSGVNITGTFRNLPLGLSGDAQNKPIVNTGETITYSLFGVPTQECNTCVSYLDIVDSLGKKTTFSLYFNFHDATPPLTITTGNLPDATIGLPYAISLEAIGGVAPYTWSSVGTDYPSPCCVLGVQSGTSTFSTQLGSTVPAPAGKYYWVLKVTDATGVTNTRTVYLNVLYANPSVTIVSPNSNTTYRQGETAFLTWNYTGASLEQAGRYFYIYLKSSPEQILGNSSYQGQYNVILFRSSTLASPHIFTIPNVSPGKYYLELDYADTNGSPILFDTSEAFTITN